MPEIPEDIMEEMVKAVIEQVTEMLARQAEIFAKSREIENISGEHALVIFARAIRSNNHNLYGSITGTTQ